MISFLSQILFKKNLLTILIATYSFVYKFFPWKKEQKTKMWDTGFPLQVKCHLNLEKALEIFLIEGARCPASD